MLLGSDTPVQPVRWRGPDEPTEAERARLRSRLSSTVEGWQWSGELSLRVIGLDLAPRPAPLGLRESVHYALAPRLALSLSRRLAVAIVCLSMGGQLPSTEDTHLSTIDLEVLDIWARSALVAAARAAGISAEGAVHRLEAPRGVGGDEPMLAAHVAWAGERPEGTLILPASAGRRARGPHGPALGDRPDALFNATIGLAARIDGPMLPLAELLRLEVGDVVLLGCKSAVHVKLNAADATVATGRPGAQTGRMAVRIERICEELRMPPSSGETGRDPEDE